MGIDRKLNAFARLLFTAINRVPGLRGSRILLVILQSACIAAERLMPGCDRLDQTPCDIPCRLLHRLV